MPDPNASSAVEAFHPLRATAFFIWRKIMSDAVCRCNQGIFWEEKEKDHIYVSPQSEKLSLICVSIVSSKSMKHKTLFDKL